MTTVKVGTFAKSTGGAPASQAITGAGFTPKALILWTGGGVTAGTARDDFRHAIGFSDGTTSRSTAMAADDNLATSNASSRYAAKALSIGRNTLVRKLKEYKTQA